MCPLPLPGPSARPFPAGLRQQQTLGLLRKHDLQDRTAVDHECAAGQGSGRPARSILWPPSEAKRFDELRKRRPGLPSARVVELVAREGRTPVGEYAHEVAGGEVVGQQIFEADPDAVKSAATNPA